MAEETTKKTPILDKLLGATNIFGFCSGGYYGFNKSQGIDLPPIGSLESLALYYPPFIFGSLLSLKYSDQRKSAEELLPSLLKGTIAGSCLPLIGFGLGYALGKVAG